MSLSFSPMPRFPNCPNCDGRTRLSDKMQSTEQFDRDTDNYVCKNGHEFEAKIPMKMYKGHLVRDDL